MIGKRTAGKVFRNFRVKIRMTERVGYIEADTGAQKLSNAAQVSGKVASLIIETVTLVFASPLFR